jgi:hypothetical protein
LPPPRQNSTDGFGLGSVLVFIRSTSSRSTIPALSSSPRFFRRGSTAWDTIVTALIEVWSYSPETEIPYFKSWVVCAKCGARGNKIDVRPNWKEQPPSESLTGKVWR